MEEQGPANPQSGLPFCVPKSADTCPGVCPQLYSSLH